MLQVRLLGQFDLGADGKRVLIQRRAGQSLFALLILMAGTGHRREKLAGIFWPNMPDEAARRNLRQELRRIRKTLPAQPMGGDYLLAEEFTLGFNREAENWLEILQLEKPDAVVAVLIANLSLYQGNCYSAFTTNGSASRDAHRRCRQQRSGVGVGNNARARASRTDGWGAAKELGEHNLKDMKYPMPVSQVVIGDLPSEFPPLKRTLRGSEVPAPQLTVTPTR